MIKFDNTDHKLIVAESEDLWDNIRIPEDEVKAHVDWVLSNKKLTNITGFCAFQPKPKQGRTFGKTAPIAPVETRDC